MEISHLNNNVCICYMSLNTTKSSVFYFNISLIKMYQYYFITRYIFCFLVWQQYASVLYLVFYSYFYISIILSVIIIIISVNNLSLLAVLGGYLKSDLFGVTEVWFHACSIQIINFNPDLSAFIFRSYCFSPLFSQVWIGLVCCQGSQTGALQSSGEQASHRSCSWRLRAAANDAGSSGSPLGWRV